MDISILMLNDIVEAVIIPIPAAVALSGIGGATVGAIRSYSDYRSIMNNLKRIEKDCEDDEDCKHKVELVRQKYKERAFKSGLTQSGISGVVGGVTGFGAGAIMADISARKNRSNESDKA